MKARTLLASLTIALLACVGCQHNEPASSVAWPANPTAAQKAQLAKNLDDIDRISAKYEAEYRESSAKDSERLKAAMKGD